MGKGAGTKVTKAILCVFVLILIHPFAVSVGKSSLPLDAVDNLHAYITQKNPYTSWNLWPGKGKMYKGRQPHGAYLTTYVNDAAFQALQKRATKFPPGSIIVKENYTPTRELVAITAMYRVDGYNPSAGDWYWLTYTPTGDMEKKGKVTSCIECHELAAANDWVFTVKP